MKITIDGKRFDTDKCSHSWTLERFDANSNRHTGKVYRSSAGKWYVYTPSQWSNQHSWVLSTPEDILDHYDSYLDDNEKAEIAELGGLDWE
jgi:hypothetical protein